MGQAAWYGPLFVVGLPRSGTKLLRDLLNNHRRVCIPIIETEFLPLWISEWERYGDLSNYSVFYKFYKTAIRLPYFQYQRERGQLVNPVTWFESCADYSVQTVFEALVRHDAGASPGGGAIWGDKSPSYVRYINRIASAFPRAKFIHIIRDVRDYCLSIETAWGKNKIRAAQRWVDSINLARRSAEHLPERYLEIRYEDLLLDPRHELSTVCEFLGIGYYESLTKLSRASENVGDAKGASIIVQENKGKYIQRMDPKTLGTIESIAGRLLVDMGYPTQMPVKSKRVSLGMMTAYQLLDGVNLLRVSIRRRGVMVALRHSVGGAVLISRLRALKLRRRGKPMKGKLGS